MIAKSGDRLFDSEALAALRSELLPRARMVTPNVPEAEVLAEMRITTLDDAREAARRIHKLGAAAVVVKGGHLPGDEAIDLLFDGRTFTEFRAPRIDTRNTHGTGCTFASAIASHLAHGRALPDAVRLAKGYVTGAIEHGLPIGNGHGPLEPLLGGYNRMLPCAAAARRHPAPARFDGAGGARPGRARRRRPAPRATKTPAR